MTLHPSIRLAVAAALVTCSAFAHAATTTVPGGRYGDVTVTQPAGPLRGFVVLYS
ncbi:MAG TPA: virulence factor family protein, partial [Paraburkholderia sp.]|nr:virulence factor family protein [Paraburkholderia sp.]